MAGGFTVSNGGAGSGFHGPGSAVSPAFTASIDRLAVSTPFVSVDIRWSFSP